jgi:phenylalanyl-tRNA synthetase beta chain
MKISYKWLSDYVDLKGLDVDQLSAVLTGCGLEVEGLEEFQSVKGGLKGLVIAEVLEKWGHPGADRLSLTKVKYGEGEPVQVVCGAPNVAAGQKVVFAPVGTIVHPTEGDSFEIKRSKIRGEESLGMICAEDEIGLGKSHEGILVLPADAPVGESAAKYFNLENDTILEVAILPNRCDAASHLGVLKDLVATLNSTARQEGKGRSMQVIPPALSLDITSFPKDIPIRIQVDEPSLCPRYSGLFIEEVKVGPSPIWLKQKLESIGQKSINNIVDITNFVLHETGQPLHAFDAETIQGNTVVVRKAKAGDKFVTLDGKERVLNGEELMICDREKPMVIAGIFGGLNSGVSETTTQVFLECAYFDPSSVRRTSKQQGIKTDSSFRFERGTDPQATVPVLLRAADLICQLAGGKVASAVQDVYPNAILPTSVRLEWKYLDVLLGVELDRKEVGHILVDLGFKIENQTEAFLDLLVPSSKNDVTRAADVVEEIIRIYGPNRIPMPGAIRVPANLPVFYSSDKIKQTLSESYAAIGLSEAMNNSLTQESYAELVGGDGAVKVLNPLSSELGIMRTSLLFGLVESLRYNVNRKASSVGLFEFGKTYLKQGENNRIKETERLGIILAGAVQPENWQIASHDASFYTLKRVLSLVGEKLGLKLELKKSGNETGLYFQEFQVVCRNKVLGYCGPLDGTLLQKFEVGVAAYFAELNWTDLEKMAAQAKTQYAEISKFPEVRRDLALLLDKAVQYVDLEKAAFQAERKLLKAVNAFDVYEGKNLPEGKKSYALSFILQDKESTLTDAVIEKVMNKLTETYKSQFGAELR